ncbi:hypothetical protein EOPP23_13945 [Endozoicomonas sp. OPT23]|uniref:hypothetical protein n=1 Tax=Endozoicomonas sp. OPT23 TaxID=2072845 RepID=UPI00129C0871|nr:hypothetical protein [Endozoicomonas sp. OPT23]MRI34093.1 hypothetical protein [Endozoicomonas sp. OPT23]
MASLLPFTALCSITASADSVTLDLDSTSHFNTKCSYNVSMKETGFTTPVPHVHEKELVLNPLIKLYYVNNTIDEGMPSEGMKEMMMVIPYDKKGSGIVEQPMSVIDENGGVDYSAPPILFKKGDYEITEHHCNP